MLNVISLKRCYVCHDIKYHLYSYNVFYIGIFLLYAMISSFMDYNKHNLYIMIGLKA
jgi:hypothetical protein